MRGELEAEQNCNMLTPTLMAITAFLSRSPGLLNRWLGTQLLWDMVLIPVFSLQLQLLNRGPEGQLWWVLVLSTASYLLTSCLRPGYIIVRQPPSSCGPHKLHSIQPVHGQGYILIFLYWMHLLFTQVHFLYWKLGRGQYVTLSLPNKITNTLELSELKIKIHL